MPQPREVADRLTDAVLRGEVEDVVGCYRPDAVVIAPEGRFEGREQIEAYWNAWVGSFSDLESTITTKLDDGGTVLDEWSMNATHTGPLEMPGGETLAATGKRLSLRGVDIAAVRDGLITEHRFYYDQAAIAEQLGL